MRKAKYSPWKVLNLCQCTNTAVILELFSHTDAISRGDPLLVLYSPLQILSTI